MRLLCLLGALSAATPAVAACVLDEEAATHAARAVVLTRICPGFPPIDDTRVPRLFEAMEAVRSSEDQADMRTSCVDTVIERVATEGARLKAVPQAERDAACAGAANDAELNRALQVLGLVEPAR